MSGDLVIQAIKSLTGAELADLIGSLGRQANENGFSGELLGLCLAEAVERLEK
jgi:hypothetical protein